MNEIITNLKKSNYKPMVICSIILLIQTIGTLLLFKKYTNEVNELDVDDESFEEEISKREWKINILTVLELITSCISSCIFIKFFKNLHSKED